VVGRLTADLFLYTNFAAESVLKEFLRSLNIWQSYVEEVDHLKCLVGWGTVLLKKMSSELRF